MSDKTWALFNEPVELTVAGRKVVLKPITAGQRLRIGRQLQELMSRDDADGYDQGLELIADQIESIEGFTAAPRDIIKYLGSVQILNELQSAVLGLLGDADSKN